MKKILLAALAAFTLCGTAWAQSGPGVSGARVVFEQVRFRSQVAANAPSVWDSVVTARVGAAGASAVLDTSVAISTLGWFVPTANAVGDSAQFAAIVVYDATTGGDCESAADSLGIAIQVSMDGATWATLGAHATKNVSTTNPIGSRNNHPIDGAFQDILSSNGASLAAGAPIWQALVKVRANQGLDINDWGALWRYPMFRIILSFHDAKGYIVSAQVAHLSAVQ